MSQAGSLMSFIRCCCMAVAAAVALGLGTQASAQIHGVQIGKSCTSPRCVGENTDCIILIGHSDGFGDTIRILDAFDIVDPTGDAVRVPAVGNLPIVSIEGNAMCTGATCDQSTGANCTLPCIVGPGNSTLSGLPGDPQPGIIRFRQNSYVIQANDPSPLQDQANVNVQDLCDNPTTSGCSDLPNLVQFTAATSITRCADEECQIEACANGVCSSTSICTVDPELCDDEDACTTDVCNDDLGDCCENTPITCNDKSLCTIDSCNPASGCVFTPIICDDKNSCTMDSCNPATGCVHAPIVCNDDNNCTTDTCDPSSGCVYTENPPCDDNDLCTTDACVPTAPGDGCVYTPIPPCNDDDACTTDMCVPATGCVYTPLPPCDDNNECTRDACVPSTGCVSTPIPADECDDDNVCTEDSCDPATGCVNVPQCENAMECEDDGNLCTREICTAEGCCDTVPVVCQDNDPCTDAICDPKTGMCAFPPLNPPPPECVDFDGCTPGFWKQPHHEQYWPDGFDPDDRVDDVFGVDSTSNPTLLQALSTGGGEEIAFLRHAVAALLNSAHGDVDYAFSTAQVIAMVQEAYETGDFSTPHGEFAEENERGCTVVKTPRGGNNDRIGGGKKK